MKELGLLTKVVIFFVQGTTKQTCFPRFYLHSPIKKITLFYIRRWSLSVFGHITYIILHVFSKKNCFCARMKNLIIELRRYFRIQFQNRLNPHYYLYIKTAYLYSKTRFYSGIRNVFTHVFNYFLIFFLSTIS